MRVYDEPVLVWPGDTAGIPARFRWKGALWSVRSVYISWAETGAWWRGPMARSGHAAAEPEWLVPETTAALVRRTEVVRVEATSSRTGESGVFELAHDEDADRWLLRRVFD